MNKFKKVLAVTLSAIMLTSLAACSKKPETSVGTDKNSSSNEVSLAPGENYEGKVGEIFKYNNSGYNITLTQIFYPNSKTNPERDTNYVVCMFEAEKEKENSDVEIVALDDFDIFADGADYSKYYLSTMSLTSAKITLGEDVDIFNGKLDGSEKKTGFISFEVPSNTNEIKLVFHPNKRVTEDTVSYTFSIGDINPNYVKP